MVNSPQAVVVALAIEEFDTFRTREPREAESVHVPPFSIRLLTLPFAEIDPVPASHQVSNTCAAILPFLPVVAVALKESLATPSPGSFASDFVWDVDAEFAELSPTDEVFSESAVEVVVVSLDVPDEVESLEEDDDAVSASTSWRETDQELSAHQIRPTMHITAITAEIATIILFCFPFTITRISSQPCRNHLSRILSSVPIVGENDIE